MTSRKEVKHCSVAFGSVSCQCEEASMLFGSLRRRTRCCSLVLLVVTSFLVLLSKTRGFSITPLSMHREIDVSLSMAKGFQGAQRKQAEMLQKKKLAQQQKKQEEVQDEAADDENDTTSQQHAEFETLLQETRGALPSQKNQGDLSYLAPIQVGRGAKQKAAKKKAPVKTQPQPKQKEPDAYRVDFESLIAIETGAPLGPIGAAQLLPWIPPFTSSSGRLIILSDPRPQSTEFQKCIEYLSSSSNTNLQEMLQDSILFISADSPRDFSRLLDRLEESDRQQHSKNNILRCRCFCDAELKWMTQYEMLSQWSLSLLVLDESASIVRRQSTTPSSILETVEEILTSQ